AGGDALDVGPHLEDDARALLAEPDGQRRRVGAPGARVALPVRGVDAARLDLEQRLAGAGAPRVDLDDVEHLRTAVRGRDHCVRHDPIIAARPGEVQPRRSRVPRAAPSDGPGTSAPGAAGTLAR